MAEGFPALALLTSKIQGEGRTLGKQDDDSVIGRIQPLSGLDEWQGFIERHLQVYDYRRWVHVLGAPNGVR